MTSSTDAESRTKSRRGLRLAAATVAVGVVGARRAMARRAPLMEGVSDELRSPVLYLPFNLNSERRLRAVRSLTQRSLGLLPNSIPDGVTVTDRMAPGELGQPDVGMIVYEPDGRTERSGALVWIHGGGMVMGHPLQAQEFCGRVASELGIVVVSVDYRLAPEDPFPAGLDDCYAALTWLHAEADALGVDPERVAVGGDSAGGGLAAALALVSRDRGGPPVCFQLLVYPMIDDRSVLRADHAGRGNFIWTPASNEFAWTAYLGRPPREDDAPPYAAPARATDLSGLPAAWVGVGDLDLFYEEDLEYARRLEAAGVPCELHVELGMYHGADSTLGRAASMRTFRGRMLEALGAALAPLASASGASSPT